MMLTSATVARVKEMRGFRETPKPLVKTTCLELGWVWALGFGVGGLGVKYRGMLGFV